MDKMNDIKTSLLTAVLCVFLFMGCQQEHRGKISYPYSQWTTGISGHNIIWRFMEGFEYNESFIKAPAAGEWESWYNTLLEYRETVRTKAGNETPYLRIQFPYNRDTKVHFDKFAYQLKLGPGEEIEVSGLAKTSGISFFIHIDFDLKTIGEETGYVVRRQLKSVDSLFVSATGEWAAFSKAIRVPEFAADSFALVPILRIVQTNDRQAGEIFIRDVNLHAAANKERRKVLASMEKYIARNSGNDGFVIPDELAWTHRNFLMGFVFVWDHKFWDPEKGVYLVDDYCRTMEKEFGGLQSVILWHSYPNIGIDEKNQFDLFHTLPGGIGGLKQVVDDFHRNGVKVFITYNPWDLDTRRPEHHDFKELARVIYDTGADGIYLDTWKSAKGVISIFEVERSMRDEAESLGRSVAFATEILPEIKDLTGPDALTSSWGQEIDPFHYTDLSHQKWIMPVHKQYYIQRMAKDRKPILAHAWINGQGVQLWENIFGTMNLWNAGHRQWLRRMNAIWKAYGHLYLTDNWRPFVPVQHDHVVASLWSHGGQVIINFVDTTSVPAVVKWEVPAGNGSRYFDIWNGKELLPYMENGKPWISVEVNDFGAVLQTAAETEDLTKLLAIQQLETKTSLNAKDDYEQELSLKLPVSYSYRPLPDPGFRPELIGVSGGFRTFISKHIWREGRCYPNMDAAHNHDLVLSFEDGAQRVTHTHNEVVPDFEIMPRVVTNGQFEAFLKATAYRPRYEENFLKHWNGPDCPVEIIDEAVVYVSLEDARAFADWAGMQLPTEWEWQLAAETLKEDFVFNEVFEWNESERFDGHNRFVTLRGGCSRWTTPSSWWYIPGAPYGEIAGGPQKHDSHVKYFLMYPGMDRASTIGFRLKK